MPLLLHLGHPVSWSGWDLQPPVISGTFIAISFYLFFVLRDEQPVNWGRALCFIAGCVSIFLALASPLDAAASRLLSMHMLQHVVLTTIGPPLVLLGLPPGIMSKVSWPSVLDSPIRLVLNPVVPALLFIVNMWVWHVPTLYESALYHMHLHEVMHMAFLATGMLYWLPVIQPLPQLPRMGEAARILYLFVTGFPMALLALLLMATSTVVYGYYDMPSRLWGISSLADQQVAGLIMGALGEAAGFVAITLLFFRFLDQEGRQPATPADAA
jgi:cytochrome c oxidase assembly factor CtaG